MERAEDDTVEGGGTGDSPDGRRHRITDEI